MIKGLLNPPGIFVCTEGKNGNECWTDTHPPEVTTTFSVYRRHASLTTARSNFSILAVDETDEPVQDTEVDVESLKLAFNWLFNFTAAGIPAPASIAQYFWTVQDQLDNEFWSIEPYQIFQSILAYPFWQFNPNNFGNVQLDAQEMVAGLPSDFYTTAAIGKPYQKIVVDRPMFVLFCILQTLVLSVAWSTFIWVCTLDNELVEYSSYPLIDFATRLQSMDESSKHDQLSDCHVSGIEKSATADDGEIRKRYKHKRVVIVKDRGTIHETDKL